jgi:hypothetical protein
LADHAYRFVAGIAEEIAIDGNGLAVNLVGPSSEVAIAGNCRGNVHRFRHGNRLAVVQRFQHGQFVGVLFDQIGQAVEQASALGSERLAHGPCSKAMRAALTAFSTSAASASAIWQISSPVEGLIVAKVLPDSLRIQRLLINNLVAEIEAWLS